MLLCMLNDSFCDYRCCVSCTTANISIMLPQVWVGDCPPAFQGICTEVMLYFLLLSNLILLKRLNLYLSYFSSA